MNRICIPGNSAGRVFSLMASLSCAIGMTPTSAFGGEVAEVEPNDTTAQANALAPGQFGRGVITFIEIFPTFLPEPDYWRSLAAVGDLVFAFADAQESSANKDSTLTVLNNDETILEVDFEDGPPAGPGSSAVVAGAVVSQAGNVYLVIGGFSDVSTTISPYRLYQAVVKPAESAAEQEPNDTIATANSLTARMMTGTVSGADVDFYKVFVRAGQR